MQLSIETNDNTYTFSSQRTQFKHAIFDLKEAGGFFTNENPNVFVPFGAITLITIN